MIINGKQLLEAAPIKDMLTEKRRENGVSYGLAEAGYDIRIKQDIRFEPVAWHDGHTEHFREFVKVDGVKARGRFAIASAIEEFQMPEHLVGVVHDKSTWARSGLSVFNTVIEPGWHGFLTLELVYYGTKLLHIPAGAGIAQVLFHQTAVNGAYEGKYQGQADRPVDAIFEKD